SQFQLFHQLQHDALNATGAEPLSDDTRLFKRRMMFVVHNVDVDLHFLLKIVDLDKPHWNRITNFPFGEDEVHVEFVHRSSIEPKSAPFDDAAPSMQSLHRSWPRETRLPHPMQLCSPDELLRPVDFMRRAAHSGSVCCRILSSSQPRTSPALRAHHSFDSLFTNSHRPAQTTA